MLLRLDSFWLVLAALACDFGSADYRHGSGCIGHPQNMFLDGSLQLCNRTLPLSALLVHSAGTQIADLVLKATTWHSPAPMAKDLFLRCYRPFLCWQF